MLIFNTCFFITVINSTYSFGSDDIGTDKKASDTEDVLYQRDAFFSAKLDGFPTSEEATSDFDSKVDDTQSVISNDIEDHRYEEPSDSLLRTKPKLNVRLQENTTPVTTLHTSITPSSASSLEYTTTSQFNNVPAGDTSNINYYPAYKEDMSIYDDVNNNRLNLRSPSEMYQILGTVLREDQQQQQQQLQKPHNDEMSMMTDSTTTLPFPSSTNGPDSTSHSYIQIDVFNNSLAESLFVGSQKDSFTPSPQPEAISHTTVFGPSPTIASTVELLSTTTRCELITFSYYLNSISEKEMFPFLVSFQIIIQLLVHT